MLGLHFEDCSSLLISFGFTNCQLMHCTFYQLKLKQTQFLHSNLTEVDFTETDLTASDFSDSDLIGAVFFQSNLEKADFRTANGFSFDPSQNRVKKALFSVHGLPGLLLHHGIKITGS